MVMVRSPSKTWIRTVGWLSTAVEKICDFLVGITEFLPMSFVITPPVVSIPLLLSATARGMGNSLLTKGQRADVEENNLTAAFLA